MIRRHDHHCRHPGPPAALADHPTLLPTPPRRYGGRARIDDRAALAGISSTATHRRPLAAAARPRAWLRQPGDLLAAAAGLAARRRLAAAAPPSAARAAQPQQPAGLVPRQPRLDQRACQAGGCLTGPNPTDRGKPGSKYHLLVDRNGTPLAACLSAANTHDSRLLEQVVDTVAPVKGPRGRPDRPRTRPVKLHLDQSQRRPALPAGAASTWDHAADVASTPASGSAATGRWWSGRWPG
jgi:hypothetical protein